MTQYQIRDIHTEEQTMRVAKVRRERFSGFSKNRWQQIGEYKNANLLLTHEVVSLTGPRFGFIADGRIQVRGVNTGYEGADYHISLEVLVESPDGSTYSKERWWITFHPLSNNDKSKG